MSTYIFTLLCEDNTDWAFLHAWKVETNFQFQKFQGPGFRTELKIKEQPQGREKSFTEGKRAFLLRPTFFFGISSEYNFHTFPPPGTRFSTFLHSPQNIQFAAKIDWCVSFSANGISLRPGEVEMKILQSWRQALPRSPPPQSSRGRSPLAPKINLAWDPNRELARRLKHYPARRGRMKLQSTWLVDSNKITIPNLDCWRTKCVACGLVRPLRKSSPIRLLLKQSGHQCDLMRCSWFYWLLSHTVTCFAPGKQLYMWEKYKTQQPAAWSDVKLYQSRASTASTASAASAASTDCVACVRLSL